jgi:hypothetical protein
VGQLAVGAIPDKLPAWVRNTDYVVLRAIAVSCFYELLQHIHVS